MFIDQLMDVDMVIAETFQIYTSVVTSFDGFDIQVNNHYITLQISKYFFIRIDDYKHKP